MQLSELRTRYFNCKQALAAADKSIENDKRDAKELSARFQLNPDDTDLLLDLEAIQARYDAHLADHQHRMTESAEVIKQIDAFYDDASRGLAVLDWLPTMTLQSGSLWSGWYGQWESDDTMRCVIGVELCEVELAILKRACRFSRLRLETSGDSYWLRVEYAAYRDTCWSDRPGEYVFHKVRELLAPAKQQQVEELLSRFTVLA
jgi:hypothetical protein